MKNLLLIILVATCFISCKEKIKETESVPLISNTTNNSDNSESDFLYKRYKALGGLTEVDAKDRYHKCNRIVKRYILNKLITNVDDLTFLARFKAQEVYKNASSEENCNYPIMVQLLIYKDKQVYSGFSEYDNDSDLYWVICNVTPTQPVGDIYVREYLVEVLK